MSSRPCHHLRKSLADHVPGAADPHAPPIRGFDPRRDARAVHALLAAAYRDAGDDFVDFADWRDGLIEDAEYAAETIFVAHADGQLAGVALCWSSGFVKDLAVAPAWRRRGIGRALMRHVFDHFARAGHAGVELKVERANASGAEQLYRSLGMVEIGMDDAG